MTVDIIPQISVTISLATLLIVGIAIVRFLMRFAVLETKVDTIWAFQMRRGFAELLASGMATRESPVTFAVSKDILDPLKDELIAFYATLPAAIGDREALLRIEEIFGARLTEIVCLPCGFSQGACLLVALAVAKQSDDFQIG